MVQESNVYTITALAETLDAALCLPIQGVCLPNGNGEIVVTGSLTVSVRECVNVAITLLRLQGVIFDKLDYHIHFLMPDKVKGGQSWGICSYIMLGWLTGFLRYIPKVAATGEIDLNGNILPISGFISKYNCWQNSPLKHLIISKWQKEPYSKQSVEKDVIMASTVRDLSNLFIEDAMHVIDHPP